MIGESVAINQIRELIQSAAETSYPVLLTGETGVGKNLAAELIHHLSFRSQRAFVPVNCAILPESLIESELFGYRKGAFTDAKLDKIGLLEFADHGTIFFDEISEMSCSAQAKLLRLVENQEVRRLGDTQTVRVDIRFIFSTNQQLSIDTLSGKFRKDLYYRINAIEIHIPPLRERPEDNCLLAQYFVKRENRLLGLAKTLTQEALDALRRYSYPGNIRELHNIIRRAIVMTSNDLIGSSDLCLPASVPMDSEQENSPDDLFRRMKLDKKSFWEVIHEPFLNRSLNRQQVVDVLIKGLLLTGGSFKKLLPMFNILGDEYQYKKFMGVLRTHGLIDLLKLQREDHINVCSSAWKS